MFHPPHRQLEALRVALGLSHRELAQILGVHFTTCQRLCTGQRVPGLALAAKIERLSAKAGAGRIAAISWVPTEVA